MKATVIALRCVLAAGLTMLAGVALAQAQLNPRWFGTWQSGDQQLVITAEAFKTAERQCPWVGTRPKPAAKACVAFYGHGLPKSQLVLIFNESERAIRRLSNDKQAPLKADERKALQADLARHRGLLRDVSNDTFRTLVLEASEEPGDCENLYFIDNAFIYESTNCPYPEANSLRRYVKAR